jgi:hypothetical protein
MCSETTLLPQIRRIKSEDIKVYEMRATNSQRRISFDLIRSSTTETVVHRNKDEIIQRTQKISIGKDFSVTKNIKNTKIRAKSSTDSRIANKFNIVPVFGDQKALLDGSQVLELISKLEISQSIANYNREEIIYIYSKKCELQNILQEKCKITIKEECLAHVLKANQLINELKTLYKEENNKLNFLKSLKSEDKRKSKILDSFVKNCKSKKTLAQDIDQKSSSWICLITNTNRLMNVTHMSPNDDGLDLIIEKTVKELKYFRLVLTYLVRIILEMNVEMMSLLIDSLPNQCISDLCISCQNFNKILISEQIKSIDLVSVVASNQAKVATNKLLYYLYNETNKNLGLIVRNESLSLFDSIKKQFRTEEITSDYFSASSNSTTFNQIKKQPNIDSKTQKDLKTVFNILIQTNQRILLKIIFGHQENNNNNQTKSSGSRQKWFKLEDDSVEKQQKLCQECDKLFWNEFWYKFDKTIESSLCFAKVDNTSVPICVLYNQTKAALISNILENCIRDEELLLEAIKSLELAQYNLLLSIAFQKWSQS